MQPTPDHAEAAAALVRPARASDPTPNPPAFDSLLAAFGRLEGTDQERPAASAVWVDAAGDHGTATVFRHPPEDGRGAFIHVTLSDSSNDDAGESTHAFELDEAERRGWELIALVHLARKGA